VHASTQLPTRNCSCFRRPWQCERNAAACPYSEPEKRRRPVNCAERHVVRTRAADAARFRAIFALICMAPKQFLACKRLCGPHNKRMFSPPTAESARADRASDACIPILVVSRRSTSARITCTLRGSRSASRPHDALRDTRRGVSCRGAARRNNLPSASALEGATLHDETLGFFEAIRLLQAESPHTRTSPRGVAICLGKKVRGAIGLHQAESSRTRAFAAALSPSPPTCPSTTPPHEVHPVGDREARRCWIVPRRGSRSA